MILVLFTTDFMYTAAKFWISFTHDLRAYYASCVIWKNSYDVNTGICI